MNNLSISNNEVLTMSSKEIANLTGKDHTNVKRDIQSTVMQLNYPDKKLKECPKFNHSELNGHGVGVYQYEHRGNIYYGYRLTKRYTELLITGYSVS